MKTERLYVPTTPALKARLSAEAAHEGISVAELVRRRVEGQPTDDELLLRELTATLRQAVEDARASMERGIATSDAVLRELRDRRAERQEVDGQTTADV